MVQRPQPQCAPQYEVEYAANTAVRARLGQSGTKSSYFKLQIGLELTRGNLTAALDACRAFLDVYVNDFEVWEEYAHIALQVCGRVGKVGFGSNGREVLLKLLQDNLGAQCQQVAFALTIVAITFCAILFCAILFCATMFCSITFICITLLAIAFSLTLLLPQFCVYVTSCTAVKTFFATLFAGCFSAEKQQPVFGLHPGAQNPQNRFLSHLKCSPTQEKNTHYFICSGVFCFGSTQVMCTISIHPFYVRAVRSGVALCTDTLCCVILRPWCWKYTFLLTEGAFCCVKSPCRATLTPLYFRHVIVYMECYAGCLCATQFASATKVTMFLLSPLAYLHIYMHHTCRTLLNTTYYIL